MMKIGTSSVAFEVLIINCHIYFINSLIFNCLTLNINCSSSSCLTSNFYFFTKSCLLQTEENGCLWSYGRASLVSDFKLTQEMMTSYLRDINKFLRYRTLLEYTKMRIPNKRYRTNTVRTFLDTLSTSALSHLV